MTAPPPLAPRPEVATSRLVATLGIAGALAGFGIVLVFRGTQPTILQYQAAQREIAVREVLQQPDRYDTLYVVDGALTPEPPADPDDHEEVFLGYRGDRAVGFAIETGEPGFQDVIRLMFGYDPQSGAVLGMKVLESKETPGLGDKVEKDSTFVNQFQGVVAPLLGVQPRSATGDIHEVDLITGATISSRTVVRAINETIARLGPLLNQYQLVGHR